jgi:hypothetical protein
MDGGTVYGIGVLGGDVSNNLRARLRILSEQRSQMGLVSCPESFESSHYLLR